MKLDHICRVNKSVLGKKVSLWSDVVQMPQSRGTSTMALDQSQPNIYQVGHDNVFRVKADIVE